MRPIFILRTFVILLIIATSIACSRSASDCRGPSECLAIAKSEVTKAPKAIRNLHDPDAASTHYKLAIIAFDRACRQGAYEVCISLFGISHVASDESKTREYVDLTQSMEKEVAALLEAEQVSHSETAKEELKRRLINQYDRQAHLTTLYVASMLGDPISQTEFGGDLAEGLPDDGLAKNSGLAADLLEAAAKEKYYPAAYKLGWLYSMEESTVFNMLKSVKWLAEACVHHEADACTMLGRFYSEGRKDILQDDKEALQWFLAGAVTHDCRSSAGVAKAYLLGKGAPKDLAMAHAWISLGASTGNKECVQMREKVEGLLNRGQLAKSRKIASDVIGMAARSGLLKTE